MSGRYHNAPHDALRLRTTLGLRKKRMIMLKARIDDLSKRITRVCETGAEGVTQEQLDALHREADTLTAQLDITLARGKFE